MIHEVPDIISQWPEYRQDFRDVHHFHSRVTLPVRLGKARLLTSRNGRVFYTHCYLDRRLYDLPTEADWLADGPHLWLMDVVWDKTLTPRQAIEALSNDVIHQDLALEGERVAFWRGVHERFGSGIARLRPSKVQWMAAA